MTVQTAMRRRGFYQQYRQHELGQAPSEESFIDPYEDSNGQ